MPLSFDGRLTAFANCAGCAGKLAPLGIAEILRGLPPSPADPNLLVGTETSDDAGALSGLSEDDLALVQTIDFFPPLVDDPFTFGQIAAANALSDVYAMNGRPLTALNIVAFPDKELPLDVLGLILRGAADRVAEAGARHARRALAARRRRVKFGLSVTGLVHPLELLTNAGARPGDLLVLTKPLGTGFITTASKKGECPPGLLDRAVSGMIQLNVIGRDALRASGGAHGLTDVTGFGLAGHASEMAEGSALTIELETRSLPAIEGVAAIADPCAALPHASRKPLEPRLPRRPPPRLPRGRPPRPGTRVRPADVRRPADRGRSGARRQAVG